MTWPLRTALWQDGHTVDSQDGMDLRPGLVVADRFRLLRPLASGGMGTIWVAHHDRLDKDIAVKFIAPELVPTPLRLARFEREARAVGKLNSQHVVQIFDCGVDRGRPYIAMELLSGEDLHTRLRRCGRFDLGQTGWLLGQMAKGLRQAHEAGIIHRDLKPANVFLARIDDEEVVKLLDFGVAKIVEGADDGNNTSTGVVVGSPNYMSPEQSRSSRAIDQRSDLWSLGVIVYRCLTGTHPFHGETPTDVIVKICTEPVTPPSRLLPGLPPAVDAFFVRALARNPADRFQTAIEVAQAFAQAAGRPWASAPGTAPPGDWRLAPSGSSPGYAAPTPLSAPSFVPAPPGSGPGFPTPPPEGWGNAPAGADGSGPSAPWYAPGAGPSWPTPPPGGPASLAPGDALRGSFPTSPGTLSSLGLVTGREVARRRTVTRVTVGAVGLVLALGAGGLVAWRLGPSPEPAQGRADELPSARGESSTTADSPSSAEPGQISSAAASATEAPSESASASAAEGKPGKGRRHPAPTATATPSSTGKPSWGF